METDDPSALATAVLILLLVFPIPVLIWTWLKGPWGKDIKFVVSCVTLFAWLVVFFSPLGLVIVPD